MNRLWVVEMLIAKKDGTKVWEPTVGCGITREGGRIAWTQWTDENPDDKFRVREYRPYGDQGRSS